MVWRLLFIVICCIHGCTGKTINFIVTHEEFFQVEGDEDDTYIRLPEHHEKALDLHLITPGENFTILNATEYEEQFAKTLRETRDNHKNEEANADNANDNDEEFYDEYDNEDDEQNNFDPDFRISDRYEDDFDEFEDGFYDSEADIYAVYDVLDTGKGRYSRGDGVYNELNDFGVVYDNIKGKYSRDYTYDDYGGDNDGGVWAEVGGDGEVDAFLAGISEDDLIGKGGNNSGEKGNLAIADEIKSVLAKTAYGYSGEKGNVDIADVNDMDSLTKPNNDNSGDRGNVDATDVKSNVAHANNIESLNNLKAANDNMRRKPSAISDGEDGVRRVKNRDTAAREIKDKVVETLVNINDAMKGKKSAFSDQGNGEDDVHKQERIRNALKLNEFGKTHEKLWNALNSNGVGIKQGRISNGLDSKGIGENQGSIRNGLNSNEIGENQGSIRNGFDTNKVDNNQARISNGLDSKGIGENQGSIRNGLNPKGIGDTQARMRNTLKSKGVARTQQRMRSGLEKSKIGEVTANEGDLENVQKLSKSLGQQDRQPRHNMRPSKAVKPGPRSKTGRRHRRVRRGAEAVWANSLPNTQPAAEKGDEPEEWKVVMDKEMTMSKEEQMADIGRHLGITLGAVAVLALFLICFVRDPKACAIACGTGCPCCVICCPCLRSFTDKYLNVKAIIKSKINEYMPGVIINPDGTLDYYEPTEEETEIMMDIMKDLKGF